MIDIIRKIIIYSIKQIPIDPSTLFITFATIT
jgi:hypothetical protein